MTTAQMLQNKPGVVGATIALHSGCYFDFLDPQPTMIHIQDIAHGLAKTCRFGGQSRAFYSVAQHSVLVSEIVPDGLHFPALMHDMAEAYVGDVVGPLKQLLPDYKIVEDRVERACCERFGLTLELVKQPEVKRADLRLLRTEQRDLTNATQDEWNGLSAYLPLKQTIIPLSPDDAFTLFMDRFTLLWRNWQLGHDLVGRELHP